ncbi:hypothetical protein H257_01623 [Aphanomyces astaci]|uniref:Reverse transcriptase n=1 Tax=Aphanomyces astaci TaxID=112090 RepID=W4H494_APHAT|nr:hypothetical protein H257_01623 [Aphanomyces astaci]ETV86426.1 hypothetical protein H257_01623 [Aphanomyces astaci]|eukprot:XP_009823225.1 hypothetical protein H257_01623 [Aphanomyces astaci]
MFLSGTFTGAAGGWAIVEKEAYAIVETLVRADYLLHPAVGFNLYTDHRNLKYIFSPTSVVASVPKYTAQKLERWALLLMGYSNVIHDIPSIGAISQQPLLISPLRDEKFVWPTFVSIAEAQVVAPDDVLSRMTKSLDAVHLVVLASGQAWPLRLVDDVIWVPVTAAELQLRLCVCAHASMESFCQWTGMKGDVEFFVRRCLHCTSASGGSPHPLGEALHSTTPNGLIHWDFVFMGVSKTGDKYLLVVKCDASKMVCLFPAPEATVRSLRTAYCSGSPCSAWATSGVSDQGTHFKNQVVAELQHVLGAHHHFTTASCPWANGTVEAVMCQCLCLVRACLSEWSMAPDQWPEAPHHHARAQPAAVPISRRYAPRGAMSGRLAMSPADTMALPGQIMSATLAEVEEGQRENIAAAQLELEEMHKLMSVENAWKGDRWRQYHEKKKGMQMTQFIVGDYVLYQDKLRTKWCGPAVVTEVTSNWVYAVENLLTHEVTYEVRPVHGSRLKFYADGDLDVTSELLAHVAQNSEWGPLTTTDAKQRRMGAQLQLQWTFISVSWVKKRETYVDKLRANAQRMGVVEWRRSAVGWIPSTDCSLLKATCTYVWRVPVEQLSEDDYHDRIMEIVGQPETKWTPTKSDMQTYCRALSVDPHGDVTSRLVSFMERVDDVIDENGLRQQLKDSTMLRTFVKVVAARVTPSYLRDRVEEQMKTVPANDLVAFADILREQLDRTHDADMVNQQRNSYGSKRDLEEDDQGRRITKHAKKANQAVRDQRELRENYPCPPGGYIKPERSAAVWSPSTQKRTGDPPATKYGPQANSRPRHDDRHVQAVRDEARPRFAPGWDDRGMLCFVCQQPGHMARECPNKKDGDSGYTSWEKGKNAVKRFKARERKANMQAKRMKKPPPPSKEDDGRWVRLNSVLEVPYCPDTGADQNIVPQAMVDELQALQPQLQVVKLAAPFVGTAYNQMPLEASSYVDLTLTMKTAAGPVKVPGKRRCYVVNDGDEFLVSDDTLKTIGIDIDRLLEQVARLQVDADAKEGSKPPGGESNQQSAWCSPVNPFLKPDGRKSLKSTDKWSDYDVLKNYRLTNDYGVVNSLTEPKAGTMPFQATILQNLRGKKAMGVFDLPKCFWQFPLHPDSWDMLSFMLNGCVYTPDRVMQGHVDSALYVQSTNEECYKDLLYKNMLIWIDDIFVYADTVEEYVDALGSFFDRVAQELQQFVCAVNWLRDSMTEYAQTVDPLQQCLTKALEGKGKKKRIASSVQLEPTDGEKLAFDAVKSKLRSSVELSHPRDDAMMCLFTDVSDHGWSIVSGIFAGAQKAWSVIEKEAYPIARACEKLNYMLMRPTGFKMYCDHKNLIHVFAPGEEWKAHTRGKLMR